MKTIKDLDIVIAHGKAFGFFAGHFYGEIDGNIEAWFNDLWFNGYPSSGLLKNPPYVGESLYFAKGHSDWTAVYLHGDLDAIIYEGNREFYWEKLDDAHLEKLYNWHKSDSKEYIGEHADLICFAGHDVNVGHDDMLSDDLESTLLNEDNLLFLDKSGVLEFFHRNSLGYQIQNEVLTVSQLKALLDYGEKNDENDESNLVELVEEHLGYLALQMDISTTKYASLAHLINSDQE